MIFFGDEHVVEAITAVDDHVGEVGRAPDRTPETGAPGGVEILFQGAEVELLVRQDVHQGNLRLTALVVGPDEEQTGYSLADLLRTGEVRERVQKQVAIVKFVGSNDV